MTIITAVRGEILDAHVAIERLFTGEAAPADLDGLLARFSDDFHLISPAGAMLDKADVRALFSRLYAARPGFSIVIDDVRIYPFSADSILATYREAQADAAGTRTTRVSTAVLTKAGAGLVWRHLHETWVPAK